MDHQDQHASLKPPVTVMIVDDDLLVRTMVTQLLEPHPGLRILGAFSGGQNALLAATDNPPDVMVIDISMPGMNGVQLTQLIRKRLPGTKVLAYTSLANEQTASAMLRAGASGVVYKDASVGGLADAIRTTHSGLSVLSPRFNRPTLPSRPSEPLSETQRQLLRLVSRGLTNEQIAPLLQLSPSTVKYHLSKLSEKFGTRNRVALAVTAVHLGLTEPSTDTDGGG